LLKNLNIEATNNTPQVAFDPKSAHLKLSGMSYPENSFEFYRPIHQWLEEYFTLTEHEVTTLDLDVTYLNSSSLKAYFDIFNILEEAQESGKKSIVNWVYDPDDDIMEETGEDFQEDFEMITVNLVKRVNH